MLATLLFATLAPFLALPPAAAQGVGAQAGPAAAATARPRGTLLVSGYTSGTVHLFAAGTGAVRGDLGTVPGAQRLLRGPDGGLYVCSETTNRVLRFAPDGTALGALVGDDPATPADETGGLAGPTGAVLTQDGALLVASFDTDAVLRYDATTGEFRDVLVPTGRGGLDGPDVGMTLGPDGALWVPSFYGDAILRFAAADGAFLGAFARGGALSRPRDLVFHGGALFVSSWGSNRVLRYAVDGTFLGVFATAPRPTGIAFDPWAADLWITSDGTSNVRQHDGLTGAFQRVFVPAGGGGLAGATDLLWRSDPR